MALPTMREILTVAAERNASDIHITVGVPPKMRVVGHLIAMDYPRLMPEDTYALAQQVMSPAQLEKFESVGEHDMSVSMDGLGRYRLNVFMQRGSVAMALRAVGDKIPSAESLGVPISVANLYQRKRGLVLVTGPTGSGKSTTLASIIDLINTNRDAHVITLEEPIEYLHNHKLSMVNQREVGLDTGSFANALRAALREDPDVILVGEMRDYETISIAITAAETGHLVFSTLHTVDAPSTIDRVIDVFPPHQQQQIRVQLANVLEAIIAQTLLPTVTEDARVAAFEVLHCNHAVRNLIREGKSHQIPSIMQTNKASGMQTMDDCLLSLYMSRKISKDNCIKFAKDPEAMRVKLM
ncbi:MAG: type IV pilus twitching motility protein PilT [Lachnospiraceae bacterium]|nr:type IV pilus twitching motility protein PilT [Lachnospiraceae bacterium]